MPLIRSKDLLESLSLKLLSDVIFLSLPGQSDIPCFTMSNFQSNKQDKVALKINLKMLESSSHGTKTYSLSNEPSPVFSKIIYIFHICKNHTWGIIFFVYIVIRFFLLKMFFRFSRYSLFYIIVAFIKFYLVSPVFFSLTIFEYFA